MRKYKVVYLKNILQRQNYKTAPEKENFPVILGKLLNNMEK